jgi:hypothetical protein
VAFGPELASGNTARLSGSSASAPYSPAEQIALWSSACGQPTEQLRTGCKILLAAGLGFGLDSREVIPLRVHDIRVTDGGGLVVVNVRGTRPRLVVCRRPWEPVWRDLVKDRPVGEAQWLFRPEAHGRVKNTVTNFLAHTADSHGTPRLVTARLRATWIVGLIDAGVPLPVIVAAAGVVSLHALSRYLPYVRAVDADTAAAVLRGTA